MIEHVIPQVHAVPAVLFGGDRQVHQRVNVSESADRGQADRVIHDHGLDRNQYPPLHVVASLPSPRQKAGRIGCSDGEACAGCVRSNKSFAAPTRSTLQLLVSTTDLNDP